MRSLEIDVETFIGKFKFWSVFNLKLMFLITFVTVTNAWYNTNYLFAAEDVKVRCAYPECEDSKNITKFVPNVPHEGKCFKYDLLDENGTCFTENYNKSNILDCVHWNYEETNSFTAEFQLGCEDWKRTLLGTVHSLGTMIGLLFVGPISDKFGRKKIIIIYGVTGALVGIAKSITLSYWLYVTLELTQATFGDPYSPTFMLGVEMITKERRSFLVTLLAAASSFGGMSSALIAWLVPYWRHYLMVIYAPSILFLFYVFFMDESIRWLLSKGRNDEAKDIIRKAASTNNVDIDENMLQCMKHEQNDSSADLFTLLKLTLTSKKILFRCLVCIWMWFTITFNHFAMLVNSVSLEGDKYLNYGLTSLAELPASFMLLYLLSRFKRKIPLMLSFLLTALCSVAQSFVPAGYRWISILLLVLAKFNGEISFQIVYLYTSELFPTYTRNTMHSLCSSIGRIGSLLAPQIPLLVHYWSGLPSVLIATVSLSAGVIVTFMPDTSEDTLPDTVHQAEFVGSKAPQNGIGETISS